MKIDKKIKKSNTVKSLSELKKLKIRMSFKKVEQPKYEFRYILWIKKGSLLETYGSAELLSLFYFWRKISRINGNIS